MSTVETTTPTDSVGVIAQEVPQKIDLSPYLYSNTATSISQTYSTQPSYTYTTGTGTAPWVSTTASPWLGNGISAQTGKLKLTGENADIDINGVSLTETLQRLEERLNILHPNTELEKEWEELRKLGDQYRALEAKLKEQGEMWAKLKAMPPPQID